MLIGELNSLEEISRRRRIPIIGREKGNWLLGKIKELRPRKILELGTANGYSGVILGSEGSSLTTVELDPRMAKEAEENFLKYNTQAKVIVGDGVKVIKELQGKFDLIFLDFAKKKYLVVLDDCLRLLNKKGCLIADNINMEKCQNFKEEILKNPRLKTEIVKIGDGLSFSLLS